MRINSLGLFLLCSVSCICHAANEEQLSQLRNEMIGASVHSGSLCPTFGTLGDDAFGAVGDAVGDDYKKAQHQLASLVAKSTVSDSRYILQSAVMANNLNDVKRLMAHDAPLVTNNYSWGASLLHIAAVYASSEIIKYLVATGIDVNVKVTDTGVTPLHLAVNANRIDNIKTLLSLGADINAVESQGATPLVFTFACHDQNTFNYLVEHGAILTPKAREVADKIGVKFK